MSRRAGYGHQVCVGAGREEAAVSRGPGRQRPISASGCIGNGFAKGIGCPLGTVHTTVMARYLSRQFADDLNSQPIADFVVVDLSIQKQLTQHWRVMLDAENLNRSGLRGDTNRPDQDAWRAAPGSRGTASGVLIGRAPAFREPSPRASLACNT